MNPTHGELFAGISGFGLGFSSAGIKTLWHVEIDARCQEVLRYHYPDTLLLADVRDCGKRNLPYADIISFGTPCQDLSVAGKRKGLKGERSGLFFEAIRIVGELKPAFAVWENVPGAFSSNSGRDFAAVLSAFRECGARDIAWRVLDAQYFGVAQRRRRIFLVADFRGECAAEVLFERESSPWDTAQSREAGKETAQTVGTLAANTGPRGHDAGNFMSNQAVDAGYIVRHALSGHNQRNDPDGEHFVIAPHDESQQTYVTAWNWQSGGDVRFSFGKPNLQASQVPAVGVRRLTPTECERLQGFPDSWTAVNGMKDTARYRMLGNAVCVPVAAWIGRRVVAVSGKE